MNKIFKVIFSRRRNALVVASEISSAASKGSSESGASGMGIRCVLGASVVMGACLATNAHAQFVVLCNTANSNNNYKWASYDIGVGGADAGTNNSAPTGQWATNANTTGLTSACGNGGVFPSVGTIISSGAYSGNVIPGAYFVLNDSAGTANFVTKNGIVLNPGTGTTDASNARITSLAPGTTGTDAVNLNQLNSLSTSTSTGISSLSTGVANSVQYNSPAKTGVTLGGAGATTPVALTNVANGVNPNDAVNFGQLTSLSTSTSTGISSLSTGLNSLSTAVSSVAGNTGSLSTSLNSLSTSTSTGISSLSTGVANSVQYDNPGHTGVTLGGAGATAPVALTNVANGVNPNDAANFGQLTSLSTSLQASGVSNYIKADGKKDGSDDASVTPNSNGVAIGSNAKATGSNAVALGANSVASQDNTVSVGSTGNERRITNVAAGIHVTDAVNLQQLNAGMQSANTYTDSRVNSLQNQVQNNQRSANAGAAAAMAAAGLPQPYLPGKSMLSMAGSTYGGQTGLALGISATSENTRWVYKAAVTSSSHGSTGGVVGAGFQW